MVETDPARKGDCSFKASKVSFKGDTSDEAYNPRNEAH
jgi:hypothetical protein